MTLSGTIAIWIWLLSEAEAGSSVFMCLHTSIHTYHLKSKYGFLCALISFPPPSAINDPWMSSSWRTAQYQTFNNTIYKNGVPTRTYIICWTVSWQLNKQQIESSNSWWHKASPDLGYIKSSACGWELAGNRAPCAPSSCRPYDTLLLSLVVARLSLKESSVSG